MHALRNIHAALVPGGMLVDTQPISAYPPVTANGAELGRLDMREWLETIRAVDDQVAVTLTAGLYTPVHDRELTVTSTFDDGPDCLEIAGSGKAPASHHCSQLNSQRRTSTSLSNSRSAFACYDERQTARRRRGYPDR